MSVLNERPKQLEHEIFKKIFDVAELANMDEVKRSEILRKMTTERDLSNQMAYAIQVGREEGIEQGREKGMAEGIKEGSYAKSVEIAKRLKEMGMPVSDIVSATGLDSDKVSEL
jgi:predicted transposase/invertase (TIGR01784 family)